MPVFVSGTVPSRSFPCRNETEPDVTAAPVVVMTEAVKVTGRPRVLGLGEPVTIVTVEKGTTLTDSVGLVEPTIPPAPEYTAVTAVDPSGSDVVVNEAVPLPPSATVASTSDPCTKLTLPVDTGVVRVETEAVNVTGRPGLLLVVELARPVVVTDWSGVMRDRRAGGADAHRNGAVHDHTAGNDVLNTP